MSPMRYLMLLTAVLLMGAPPAMAEDAERSQYRDPNWNPPAPKEGYSYPECYCTDTDGQRVGLGELACLRIGQREVTARCETSLNNTIWRDQFEGCPGV